MEQKFEFSGRLKTILIALMGIGLIAIVIGFFQDTHRTWASILMYNYWILGLGVLATFFVALQYVANAGWSTVIKRVPEAITTIIPIAGLTLLLVLIFGHHDLYHWTHEGLMDPESADFDKLLYGKKAWLNLPFMYGRAIGFIGLWTLGSFLLRKLSRKEDIEGGLIFHKKSITLSAAFIFVFAFTFCFASFDWIMGLEPHWFSTIFGVYNFASIWVTLFCTMTLIVLYLKRKGYLEQFTDNHLHDFGKFIFAFSIFWAYIWFSQFLLIYYANFPEETVYFHKRIYSDFNFWFFFNVIINFLSPLLILMSRDWKRNHLVMTIVCCLLLFGHGLDLYLMIMPGAVGVEGSSFGIPEIGPLFFYAGLFLFVVFNSLSKGFLIPQKHPYLEESLHHNQ